MIWDVFGCAVVRDRVENILGGFFCEMIAVFGENISVVKCLREVSVLRTVRNGRRVSVMWCLGTTISIRIF